MNKIDVIEQCAKRIETYAFSLAVQRHIGLPDPVDALEIAAQKVRELAEVLFCDGKMKF